jgi:hypothetical protein
MQSYERTALLNLAALLYPTGVLIRLPNGETLLAVNGREFDASFAALATVPERTPDELNRDYDHWRNR